MTFFFVIEIYCFTCCEVYTYQVLFLCIGAVILNFTHKSMAKDAGHDAIAKVILGAAEI